VAIKALKFQRKLYYVPAFVEILCAAAKQLPNDIDAVLPVPLHWRRKMTRGFNQATELAGPLAKHLALPVLRGVYRKQATPFQTGLTATERERNLRRAFAARRKFTCKHVLIVDDVITTGATTRSLARLLLANGVCRVSVVAIARAG
jgi:ComF family protein